ncbi:MAG: UbiD family decarboxylase [Burkholderiales bacterium]|nr:UbiD family decarboxylase [Burkholderiales bacterium]
MPFQDLREFLTLLEERGHLARVKAQVSPNYEIGAICRKVLNDRGPALLFEKVEGSDFPLAANVMGTRERYALGLGTTPERLADDWALRTQEPRPPVIVDSGPCQENVLIGDDADLTQFANPVWNELDGGPFITMPCHISKDQQGNRNVGMYRGHVFGPRALGILAGPYRHIVAHQKQTTEPFPVAIAIGVDPAVYAATVAPFPYGVDEFGMAGALRGAPIELVRCKTIPLEVPATAEIVIEGTITRGDVLPEGPYAEFTGFSTRVLERPVIRISAITHRHGAINLGTYNGVPPQESLVMTSVPMEAEIKRLVPLPGIKQVNVTEEGCGAFICVVSCEKAYEGHAKAIALGVLGTPAGRFIKILVMVDANIDAFNPAQVQWAISTCVQPHRDVQILNDMMGIVLDPSIDAADRASGFARTSKMIIDATRYKAHDFEPIVRPEPQTMARVEREWAKYGLKY